MSSSRWRAPLGRRSGADQTPNGRKPRKPLAWDLLRDLTEAVDELSDGLDDGLDRRRASDQDRVIGVVPGQGWMLAMDIDGAPESERTVEPVIGWVVHESGWAQALRLCDGGWAMPVESEDVRVFHPDERVEPGCAVEPGP